ncbi:MAG: N-6 DNA methylase, partial [Polyangiales bacterium]
SLLELSPSVASNGTFELKVVSGNDRKMMGAYYTPSALVEVLLEQSLDPVLDEACAKPESERQEALLSLTVCDPACGSGHFLLAAARRIARRLAGERAHGNEPSPEAVRHALREVIARCIYGVDINPMAVELCKVSLWMEALEPGLPLSFLDGHIQCGNALLGATPALMRKGIPEGAFDEIEGDDKKVVKALKKQHKAERSGQLSLGAAIELPVSVRPADVHEVEKSHARTIEAERQKQRAYEDLVRSERYQRAKFLADAWCSVFVIPKTADTRALALTEETWRRLVGDSHAATSELRSEVERRSRRFQFFHWHVAFPQVFDSSDPNAAESVAGWTGGFDVVLGNPPWVAHAGRAAHPLPPGVKRFYESNYSAFADYPTTHGVFVSVAPTILREGGRLGLIIPSSVSELGGYEPTRAAHDRLCAFDGELVDFGEGQFVGVTQPSMALVSRRATGGRKDAQPGQPWPVARPDMTALDRALLQRLASMPTLPSELFGDRGLQSDRSLAEHICETRESTGRFSTAIREGADIREFELLPAQHYVDAEALAGRLRPLAEFAEVRVVIRQTARYPIAALSDGAAFRNSLLAGFESSEWPAAALVALLNSALIRWCHYMRYRDARQPVMPQVKVGHLKSVPAPAGTTHAKELVRLSNAMVEALDSERASVVRRELDAFVSRIYGLSVAEADAVQRWHDRLGPRARDVSAVSAEASAGPTSRAPRGRRAKDPR